MSECLKFVSQYFTAKSGNLVGNDNKRIKFFTMHYNYYSKKTYNSTKVIFTTKGCEFVAKGFKRFYDQKFKHRNFMSNFMRFCKM